MIKHKRWLHTTYNNIKNDLKKWKHQPTTSGFVLPFLVPLTLSLFGTLPLLLFDLTEPSVELVAESAVSLFFTSKQNELSIKLKKSVLSSSGSIAHARVPASSCCLSCVKILVARIIYDILYLIYVPDCPLKYRPFSCFTLLTKRLKIAIRNKLRTESPANLHCKLKLGTCPSLPVWQIYDRFLRFELLL